MSWPHRPRHWATLTIVNGTIVVVKFLIRSPEESEALLDFCHSVGSGLFVSILNNVHAL